MKKYIIILFSMLTLAGAVAFSQINPIKRGQKSKVEQTKGQKKKQSPKKSTAQNQHKANDSESARKKAIQTAKEKAAEAAQSVADRLVGRSIETISVDDVSIEMVYVEGGKFKMGATIEQGTNVFDDEKPVHEVNISDFYICKYEVTQALWQAVMGNNPSHFTYDMQCPVDCVSWNDCQIFIRKLNEMTGKQFRLPTEAEWEFAARGGNRSRGYIYSGSNSIDNVAWYVANSGQETHPVGTKYSNELGLFDMSGNVTEWCQDWWGSYNGYLQTNPKGAASGTNRISRGGCYNHTDGNCRVARRLNYYYSISTEYQGLRLAADTL